MRSTAVVPLGSSSRQYALAPSSCTRSAYEPAANTGAYRNPLVSVAACASGFVTTTLTAPAACAPVVQVIVVALTTTTDVAATPPIATVAPETKLVPVRVTAVPPPIAPCAGAIALSVGAGPATLAAA